MEDGRTPPVSSGQPSDPSQPYNRPAPGAGDIPRRGVGQAILAFFVGGSVVVAVCGTLGSASGPGILLVSHVLLFLAASILSGRLLVGSSSRTERQSPDKIAAARATRAGWSVVRLVLTAEIYFVSLIAIGLILGAFGCLTQAVLLTVSVGVGMLAMLLARVPGGCGVSRRIADASGRRKRRRLPSGRSLVAAALFVLVGLVSWQAVNEPTYAYDTLTYHLFFPARWIQDARISIVPTWFGDPAPAYAPSAAEVFYVWLMLPMGSDDVARCGQLPFWWLLLGGAVLLARELRIVPTQRLLACLAVATIPAIWAQAGTAMVDVAFAAAFVCCTAFALRCARTRRAADWVGLLLALCLLVGTKLIGLAYLIALLPVLAWALLANRSRRGLALARGRLSLACAILPAALVGGFWYARNAVETGNPVYPLEVRLGGRGLLPGAFGPDQLENSVFNVRRRGDGLAVASIAWDALHASNAPSQARQDSAAAATDSFRRWYVGPAGLIGGLLLLSVLGGALRWGQHHRVTLLLLLASVVLGVLVFWYVLPFQEARFLWGPIVCAVVVGFATTRLHRLAHWLVPPLILAVWAISFGRELCDGPLAIMKDWRWAALVLAVVVLGGFAWISVRKTIVGLPFCAILAAAVVMTAVRSTPDVRTAEMERWRFLGPAWSWIDGHVHGATIAYTGNNVPYFLCGRQLENRVVYVPARLPADGQHHDFALLPESRALGPPNTSEAAFDRFIMDPRVWWENLRRLGVEYVFTNSMFPGLCVNYRHDLEGFPVERRWLDALVSAPRSADGLLLAEVATFAGNNVRLYRVHPEQPIPDGVRLDGIVRDETDALDRARHDATPPDTPIRDYPHAWAFIRAAGLKLPSRSADRTGTVSGEPRAPVEQATGSSGLGR